MDSSVSTDRPATARASCMETKHMIDIDPRTGSRDLVNYPPLSSLARLTRLNSADVRFVGQGPDSTPILIGIELKSILNLVSSISSGQLQSHQIPNMLVDYDVRWLLYYGAHRSSPRNDLQIPTKNNKWRNYKQGKSSVPYGYVYAFLSSPSFTNTGFFSQRVSNVQEAASWIGVLYRTWQKPYHKHSSMKRLARIDYSLMPTANPDVDRSLLQRAKIAQAIEGLGYERAMAAANHFPTPRAMLSASAGEWSRVPGIGKVVANNVVRVATGA